MIAITEKPYIDPKNMVEREINGCRVRLFFSPQRNEKIERLVLGNLILAFDRKMQGGVKCTNIKLVP